MRLALIIRLTIGKAYYENTFRVFHHSLYKQTLLFNASNRFPLYRNSQGIPTNLRSYDFVWYSKHDLSPRIYSTDDIINLVEGPAIFGRKFDIKVHPEAVKKLAGCLAVRI